MYPEKLDMERMVVNGTFDWSKTAKSVLFLKKHKCARKVISNKHLDTKIQHINRHAAFDLYRGFMIRPRNTATTFANNIIPK